MTKNKQKTDIGLIGLAVMGENLALNMAFDAAMGFGGRAENAEAPEVEIETIGRRVDAAQGTVELEVVEDDEVLI